MKNNFIFKYPYISLYTLTFLSFITGIIAPDPYDNYSFLLSFATIIPILIKVLIIQPIRMIYNWLSPGNTL